MPNTTTSEVTNAVDAFLDRTLLSRAYPHFVHVLWAQVRDIPLHSSTQIRFRKYGSLSAATTALTEGITPTATALSVSDTEATPLQYGAYVTTTDYLDMTVIENLKTEMAQILGDQMGDTIDELTRDVITAGSTIQYASTAANRAGVLAGMVLNGDEVREAERTLQGNNAKTITSQINPGTGFNTSPVAAAYIGIISHNTLFDLRKDADWVPVEEYAASEGRLGVFEVGKLSQTRFVLAGSNAKTISSTVTVHMTVILGQEAYGITRIAGNAAEIVTKPRGAGEDPLNQRSTMGWKITFVAKRLQEAFMLRIEHAVSS